MNKWSNAQIIYVTEKDRRRNEKVIDPVPIGMGSYTESLRHVIPASVLYLNNMHELRLYCKNKGAECSCARRIRKQW